MDRRSITLGLATLVGGCSSPAEAMPADADLIQQFLSSRTSFERVATLMDQAPQIAAIDLQRGRAVVVPTSASPERVTEIARLLDVVGATYVGSPPDGDSVHVGFRMYARGLSVSGILLSIVKSDSPPEGDTVKDVSATIRSTPIDRFRTFVRPIADDWYLVGSVS